MVVQPTLVLCPRKESVLLDIRRRFLGHWALCRTRQLHYVISYSSFGLSSGNVLLQTVQRVTRRRMPTEFDNCTLQL